MIGRLSGKLLQKQPPSLLLDVAGVGYEVDAPMSTFYDLPAAGETVSLFIHMSVKEDSHLLFGFLTESERSLFRALIRVSGVGAKTALAVLSGASVDELARLVQTGDVASLKRLPGVGQKTAERLIVELKDRIGVGAVNRLANASASVAVPHDPVSEATVALAALGYKPVEVTKLVREAATPGMSSEDIIRQALRLALKVRA